jgi:hypothetical protein
MCKVVNLRGLGNIYEHKAVTKLWKENGCEEE